MKETPNFFSFPESSLFDLIFRIFLLRTLSTEEIQAQRYDGIDSDDKFDDLLSLLPTSTDRLPRIMTNHLAPRPCKFDLARALVSIPPVPAYALI